MSDKTTIAETEGGKKIIVEYDRKATLYRIKFSPGGQLPKDLEGLWTSPTRAAQAVTQYLNKAKKKESQKEVEKAKVEKMKAEDPRYKVKPGRAAAVNG